MLPTGIQDFDTLRVGGYIYVDKTAYIAEMLRGAKYQFFARPRRFGKSLLVSTLKALFEGKRELFKGLWIENKHDFKPRPIIHMDFSRINLQEKPLEVALLERFHHIAQHQGIQLKAGYAKDAFEELILALAKTERVVILVDEYDKPITDYLDNPAQRQHNQDILKSVYGLIKPMDGYLHYVLLTGVSKFGRLSLFSDLNNLLDVSLKRELASLCGYTQEEIADSFPSYIEAFAQQQGLGPSQLFERLKFWYNGYSWDGKTRLYCPFSVLNAFDLKEFKPFWYETGTPTFLIKLIKQEGIEPFYLEGLEASTQLISVADIEHLDPISVMFQTGYLTIQSVEYSQLGTSYTLGYPNEEVRQAFSGQLLEEYLGDTGYKVDALGFRLRRALATQDWNTFFQSVNQTLAGVPYQIFPQKESYFHSLVHLMLVSTGYKVGSEVSANKGRMDTVVETLDRVVIFEFKLTGTPKEALQQIQAKGYDRPFSKPVTYVGVVFDAQQKQVGAWEVSP